MIVHSSSSDVIWYRRSADRILIRFSKLTLLQQSARCNVKPISQSTVSIMKKKLFRNVEVKAPSSNFSRCSECDFLQDYISRYPRGCDEWATLVNDRTKHINYQNACRRLYHGWSSNSLTVLRSSSALFTTKWITPNLPSPECSGLQRRHPDLDRSPYLLPGCSRMDTVTERMLTTPQHFGPETQTSLSPLFVGF